MLEFFEMYRMGAEDDLGEMAVEELGGEHERGTGRRRAVESSAMEDVIVEKSALDIRRYGKDAPCFRQLYE